MVIRCIDVVVIALACGLPGCGHERLGKREKPVKEKAT